MPSLQRIVAPAGGAAAWAGAACNWAIAAGAAAAGATGRGGGGVCWVTNAKPRCAAHADGLTGPVSHVPSLQRPVAPAGVAAAAVARGRVESGVSALARPAGFGAAAGVAATAVVREGRAAGRGGGASRGGAANAGTVSRCGAGGGGVLAGACWARATLPALSASAAIVNERESGVMAL